MYKATPHPHGRFEAPPLQDITKTCPCNIQGFQKMKIFSAENFDIFLIFAQIKHIQYSQRDVYISHAYERGISHVT